MNFLKNVVTGEYSRRDSYGLHSNAYYGLLFNVITMVLLVLLCVNVINYSVSGLDGGLLTFERFLSILENTPKFDTSFLTVFFNPITDDWLAFNFLRDFINSMSSIFGVLLYVCSNIGNVLVIIFYFLAQLFSFA